MPDATTKQILISYDGSEDARQAIEFAGTVAPGRNALVLSVWEPASVLALGYPMAILPPVDDAPLKEAAERLAAEGADRARAAGFEATSTAVAAKNGVAGAIVDTARERDVALIVMGTRGLTGLRSLLLGSVSHAVAQHAQRPLLIVPSAPLAEARAGASPPA